MQKTYWFKSSELNIVDGEDEETNPMRYGKSVALWLKEEFSKSGYTPSIYAEDWGWRLDCTNDPCSVWIGCGNVDDMNESGEFVEPTNENIVWHCFVQADVPFFTKLFSRINPENSVNEIASVLNSVIKNTSHISEVEEP